MLARLRSLGLWLFFAMVGTAAISLAAAYFVFGHLAARSERTQDSHKAAQVGRVIAAQVARGADAGALAAIQAVLPNDRITVTLDGRLLYAGPEPANPEVEATTSTSFTGGRVTVIDHKSPDSASLIGPTAVAAALLVLMIAVTMATTNLLTRAIRIPIRRAIAAADRLAAGDLTARMGPGGPDEFGRLAQAFDVMAARLEAAEREQHRFLADVAHEVATPVNTLTGFAISLADGVAATGSERAEAAEFVRTESARLHGLLRDLRLLTRLDLAEATKLERVDCGPVFAELLSRFSATAAGAHVDLNMHRAAGAVVTDRRLLVMILDNLVANAIQHTPAGGRVDVSMRRTRQAVTFVVRDTGTGIAKEHQARVFDRLYRVEQARDRNSGGSGLGLALAQRAARSLQGRLELRSALGNGSEFSLVIPPRLVTEPQRSLGATA